MSNLNAWLVRRIYAYPTIHSFYSVLEYVSPLCLFTTAVPGTLSRVLSLVRQVFKRKVLTTVRQLSGKPSRYMNTSSKTVWYFTR
jgi:hypothetical protein